MTSWLEAAAACGGLLSKLRKVSLWDCDAPAVEAARADVQKVLDQLGLTDRVVVQCFVGDTLLRPLAEQDRADLVLTNPPWELLKPDRRDQIEAATEYRTELRGYAGQLQAVYPEASGERRQSMGGYGVNLARAGALAAVRLSRPGALLGIVLPATIFADQSSAKFRERFFGSVAASEMHAYPAEARLFAGVDQSFVTLLGVVGEASLRMTLTRHALADGSGDSRQITFNSGFGAPIALGLGGSQEAIVNELKVAHPQLRWLESDLRYSLWLGRELDETRLAEFLTNEPFGVSFLKGRELRRYEPVEQTSLAIDPNKRRIPTTVSERRVAWRDVTRATQARRVQAAHVKSGIVTGNSVGVGFFRSGDPSCLDALLAVMNSVVFEVQVRGALVTNHVSQGVLRGVSVPYSLFEDKAIFEQVCQLVPRASDAVVQRRLDALVAKAYGLEREALGQLLQGLPKLPANERDLWLAKDVWN